MANTYTLISSNTLSSTAATVTLSSIPNTYTDLVLQVSARGNSANPNANILFTFNNDTASNYSSLSARGDGPSTVDLYTISGTVTTNFDRVPADSSTANVFGTGELYIVSYGASRTKAMTTFFSTEINDSTGFTIGQSAHSWSNSAAISSITMELGSGSFVSGSTFYLYGIKNT